MLKNHPRHATQFSGWFLTYLDGRGVHSESRTGTLEHHKTHDRVREYRFHAEADKPLRELGINKYLVLKSDGKTLDLVAESSDLRLGSPAPRMLLNVTNDPTNYRLRRISVKHASEVKETRHLVSMLKLQAVHNLQNQRAYWAERAEPQ